MNILDFEKLKKFYENEFNNGFWNMIIKNPEKRWDWNDISKNPNITWDIIKKNPDKDWNWNLISMNDMKNGKEKWIKNKIKIEILKKISYKILCNIIDSDICELIINYI